MLKSIEVFSKRKLVPVQSKLCEVRLNLFYVRPQTTGQKWKANVLMHYPECSLAQKRHKNGARVST